MGDIYNDDFDFEWDYEKAAQNRSECWTEDNWQEQMEKHPMFMTQVPGPGQDSPLIEAITQLKYDPEFNSVLELMENYKVDGNENFRLKKYKWAIDSYSEGIKIARKQNLKDVNIDQQQFRNLLSILHNNCATSHFYLQNYRSAALDAFRAIVIDPTNQKAIIRLAKCYYHSKKYQKCIQVCDELVKKGCLSQIGSALPIELSDETRQSLIQLAKDATNEWKIAQREDRKRKLVEDKQKLAQSKVEKAVKLRNIQYRGSLFECEHSISNDHLVHFYEPTGESDAALRDSLVWPVIFIYPKYGQSDFIKDFHEMNTFDEQLSIVFKEPAEWDTGHIYYPTDRLKIFYYSYEDEQYSGELKLKEISRDLTLLQALQLPDFVVSTAVPTFVLALDDKF